jgi:dihydrofolate reductase
MSIMGMVRVHMSTSLDGFVTGPDVSVEQPMGVGGERLHEWMFAASDVTDIETAAEMFSTRTTGAVVMGRRTFDVGERPWGDDGTFHLPCFVLTHRAAPTLVKGKTSFTFVTEGPERALALAQTVAGDKVVNVMGADTLQQFLRRGLIDEIQLNVIPVLLQTGTRLFEHLGPDRVELERTRAILPSSGVTHLTFRIPRRR